MHRWGSKQPRWGCWTFCKTVTPILSIHRPRFSRFNTCWIEFENAMVMLCFFAANLKQRLKFSRWLGIHNKNKKYWQFYCLVLWWYWQYFGPSYKINPMIWKINNFRQRDDNIKYWNRKHWNWTENRRRRSCNRSQQAVETEIGNCSIWVITHPPVWDLYCSVHIVHCWVRGKFAASENGGRPVRSFNDSYSSWMIPCLSHFHLSPSFSSCLRRRVFHKSTFTGVPGVNPRLFVLFLAFNFFSPSSLSRWRGMNIKLKNGSDFMKGEKVR